MTKQELNADLLAILGEKKVSEILANHEQELAQMQVEKANFEKHMVLSLNAKFEEFQQFTEYLLRQNADLKSQLKEATGVEYEAVY